MTAFSGKNAAQAKTQKKPMTETTTTPTTTKGIDVLTISQ
jgi:hypothetical protein